MLRALPALAALSSCVACAPDLDPQYGSDGAAPSGRACRAELAPHDVQGAAAISPLVGQTLDVAGVATLAAAFSAARPGFFLESLEADDDPLTSEAVFIAWHGPPPAAGTRVRARGTVAETAGLTEIGSVERLDECGADAVVPIRVDVRELEHPEAWEGMWVRARGDWCLLDAPPGDDRVTASPRGRLYATGHALADTTPPELWTLRAANAARALGYSGLAERPPQRLGAELSEIDGVLFVEGQSRQLFTAEEPKWPAHVPAAPPRPPGAGLRLVGLNLRNYFVSLGSRGARTTAELARQRDSLVATLVALDADILALTELENRGAESLIHLLEGLDRALPSDQRYAFEEAPAPSAGLLRAGIAYRPRRVRPRGPAWFSNSAGFRRAPLFQSFESEGLAFVLGVVHLASKRCDGEPTLVPGEGCGDEVRRREAELLLDEARALDERAPREPLLLMGDFNADEREAPLERLALGGFGDLLAALAAPDRYSYVYEGRASLLDHALARSELAAHVRGSAIWHINADDTGALDAALGTSSATPQGSSDHDPIVVDLRPPGIRPAGL